MKRLRRDLIWWARCDPYAAALAGIIVVLLLVVAVMLP
jgi:hypothetical protein